MEGEICGESEGIVRFKRGLQTRLMYEVNNGGDQRFAVVAGLLCLRLNSQFPGKSQFVDHQTVYASRSGFVVNGENLTNHSLHYLRLTTSHSLFESFFTSSQILK